MTAGAHVNPGLLGACGLSLSSCGGFRMLRSSASDYITYELGFVERRYVFLGI